MRNPEISDKPDSVKKSSTGLDESLLTSSNLVIPGNRKRLLDIVNKFEANKEDKDKSKVCKFN